MIPYRRRKATRRIILHASHTSPDRKNIWAFLTVRGREMGLLDIGYHYAITPEGIPITCRPHDAIGSHTPGFNEDSLGVVFWGGVDGDGNPMDTFTGMQKAALRFLRKLHEPDYGLLPVVGHTELGRHKYRITQCPPLDMAALRRGMDE